MHSQSVDIYVGPSPWFAGPGAMDPLAAAFGVPATVPGRRALTSVLDTGTFKWAILALSLVIGLFLLVVLIWAVVTKCGRGRSSPVVPGSADAAGRGVGGDVEKGPAPGPVMTPPVPQQAAMGGFAGNQTPAPPASAPPPAPPGLVPVPPWHSDPQRLPPGIMLTPLTPPLYSPLVSNPRLASEPPYERLVLISSRVHNPDMVARAVLSNVAFVVYDWKNFTLQELLRYVKKALGAQKVSSVAVVAPGGKAGAVGLLEGAGTSADKLASKTELSQFWRVLAGCVALSGGASGGGDGRRVDLLGCRVVEAPREGAALLKELWNLTTVPFAAADDALGGYLLCTFMEEPTTKQLSLISSTIPAIDLYFDRFALLGIPPPGAERAGAGAAAAASAPLPPGPPPPGAIAPVGTAPPLAPQPPSAPSLTPLPLPPDAKAAAPPPPLPPAAGDVFSRLSAALQQRGKTPDAAFSEYDRDGNGQLSTAELTQMMVAHLPDASSMDVKHFQAMLDTDALPAGQERLLSRKEFVEGMPENVWIQEQVRAGRDDDEVARRLQEYLTDNDQILRDTFEQFDENADGHLDHTELQELILSIPGLDPAEKKFILAMLYVHDNNRDMRISLDELLAALDQFRNKGGGGGGPAHTVARSASFPPPAAAPAVPAALPPPAAPQPAADGAAIAPPGKQQDGATAAATAAVGAAPPPLPPPVALLAPLGPPSNAPLGPPGGKLMPLAPLGPLGGGGAPPRPGALAPLAPLPGR